MRGGQTTALTLPDGGVLEIPLPGGKGRFSVKSPSLLSMASGGSRIPLILVGVVIGAAVGAAATAYYLSRR